MRISLPAIRRSSAPPVAADKRKERVAQRYVVKQELAAGGMGVVYQVHDRSNGVDRALKRMHAAQTKERHAVEAFEREYRVLAGLEHPRIIRVFEYGVDETGPYYTMELLDGEDLRKAAPLPYAKACLYLRDVATSLSLLHARRLIHRDVSAGNVRVTADGHCKLLDFGALAAFGKSTVVVGTPPSIPPEALRRVALDQRADLYALGALGYFLLTGRQAYPARTVKDLPEAWKQAPVPPSTLVQGVPADLEALLMALLSADPLARPASAAEVISRLNAVAELAPEQEGETARLAQSFLLSPRFIGRTKELREIEAWTAALADGRGGALRIEAAPGMGRTRLLDELSVHAQLAGACVLRVDASVDRKVNGTALALGLRLLDALPQLARELGRPQRGALAVLGAELEARLLSGTSQPPVPATSGDTASYAPVPSVPASSGGTASYAAASSSGGNKPAGGSVEAWFAAVSDKKPLVIAVDDVEYADDASLGLLVALARLSLEHPILLVVAECVRREARAPMGLATLRASCGRSSLEGLNTRETLSLVRSMFGDTQRIERFAEWLYGRTAGSPLHCIEISRQLVAKEVIRYVDGTWVMPVDRPDVELPAGLEDTLRMRVTGLSEAARGLAECLSLQREQPTLALCRALVDDGDERKALHLLDELARNDVLHAEQDGYRFSSMALRETLLSGMDELRLAANHRRLGEAFARLADSNNAALRIEAGWHLIEGGDELGGADLIAAVCADSATVRTIIANLHHCGGSIEAALMVYKRYRRSSYQRIPLLSALAHAAYYEDRHWGERYGDEALDVCEDLSGVRSARRLQRFLGKWLGLGLGIAVGFLRFQLTPKRERNYGFVELLTQLFGTVTTLTAMAAVSLDRERAGRVAHTLKVFAHLPERTTPVGIYQFCCGLQEITRDNQAHGFQTFDVLVKRFENPRWYLTLPDIARPLYTTGAHFARGSFAIFRNDGRLALESADALDASGIKLYAMVASQLRFLYYTLRGEAAKAAPHREQVEVHAAHAGSAWQVETWEGPALIPVYTTMLDVVSLAHVVDRLEVVSASVPSLKLYRRLAKLALGQAHDDHQARFWVEIVEDISKQHAPRSFVGWGALLGFLARYLNLHGDHVRAKLVCETVLVTLTDADKDYVAMYLGVDIEMAIAEAGLGETDAALRRIDGLLERWKTGDHPLVQGGLHEARARICWAAGRADEYEVSLAQVERWFRPTGTPTLIAKCERLAQLRTTVANLRSLQITPEASSTRTQPGSDSLELPQTSGGIETSRDIKTVRAAPGRRQSV